MYTLFVQIALATYIILFVLQSLSNHLFGQLFYLKFTKYICDKYKQWISTYPDDEWISAKVSNIVSDKKLILNKEINAYESDSDSDSDIDKELQLGDMNTIVRGNRIKNVLKSVVDDNSSSFTVAYKSIMLIVYIKLMVSMGHINELLVGILIGGIYHTCDLLLRLSGKVNEKFFDNEGKISIESILTNNKKISYKSLLTYPLATIFTLTLTKATVYTRVLGEWVMDMNSIYLYFGQILGFSLVQNLINLVSTTKTRPMLILLTLVYIGMSMFI